MKAWLTPAAASALLLAAPVPAPAQDPAAPEQLGEDHRQVMAVVVQLFAGMREKDTTKMRATLHPEARLVATGMRDGVPIASVVSPTQWLAGIAGAAAILDERVRNPVIHLDQGLASVWLEYTFYIGDRLSHCGVDLFHLVRTAQGWRIIDLADTRRREGCPP